MDPQFQVEFRTTLYKKYQEMAFESFAIYTYWGNRYEAGKKDVDAWEARIKEIQEKLVAIEAAPMTPESKEARKNLKSDLNLYQKNIANVEAPMKKLFEKSANARGQALELLEQAEYIKEFKLATPDEIKAKKDAPQADVAAVVPEAPKP